MFGGLGSNEGGVAAGFVDGSNFRFMLGFDELNFISPWFSVKDMSRGSSLVMLNIVFVFSGTSIIDVKWDADCKFTANSIPIIIVY